MQWKTATQGKHLYIYSIHITQDPLDIHKLSHRKLGETPCSMIYLGTPPLEAVAGDRQCSVVCQGPEGRMHQPATVRLLHGAELVSTVLTATPQKDKPLPAATAATAMMVASSHEALCGALTTPTSPSSACKAMADAA